MPATLQITKSTAQGETFVVEVSQLNRVTGEVMHTMEEMTAIADEAFKLSDDRMQEMNMRVIYAYGLERYCPPDIWNTYILDILEVLSGRVSADTIARRWHSRHEETAELEAGRLAALNGTHE